MAVTYIARQFLLDQRDHYSYNDICIISLQKKEISALIIDLNLFSLIYLMSIYNNITL